MPQKVNVDLINNLRPFIKGMIRDSRKRLPAETTPGGGNSVLNVISMYDSTRGIAHGIFIDDGILYVTRNPL